MLVDDETDILAELAPFLEREGYVVETAVNGRIALQKCASRQYDLMVLDVDMPEVNGREVLRTLREQNNWIPIILLTKLTSPADRKRGYVDGANDFIDKDFDPDELAIRIHTQLKIKQQYQSSTQHRLSSQSIMLDRITRKVHIDGQEVRLRERAYTILTKLMENAPDFVDHKELEKAIDFDGAIKTNAVRQRISELRNALGTKSDLIENMVGVGYRFNEEVQAE
ncbi:MAG: DNA-binding response regulator [Chloroflexi bacterium]|nr:MAG: DNA-binding response regulator [Chloroflexota bacterium]